MNRLRDTLSQIWLTIRGSLFPWLEEELGPLTEKQQELVTTLELIRIEAFIPSSRGFPGRPLQYRTVIARAFVAKMVYHMPTTRVLLDRLDPAEWLKDTLEKLPTWPNSRIDELLPFATATADSKQQPQTSG